MNLSLSNEDITKIGYDPKWFDSPFLFGHSLPEVVSLLERYIPEGGYFEPTGFVRSHIQPSGGFSKTLHVRWVPDTLSDHLVMEQAISVWVMQVRENSRRYQQSVLKEACLATKPKEVSTMSRNDDDNFVCSRKEWRGWFRSRRADREQAKRVFRAAVALSDFGPRELARKLRAGDEEARQAVLTVGEEHPEWDIDIDRLKEILEFILEFIRAIMILFV